MTTSAPVRASDPNKFVPDAHLLGIRDVLYKIAGIFQQDHDLQVLETHCFRRMNQLRIGLLRSYFEHLVSKPSGHAETALLLNEILIGETRFFRDVPQLDALRKILLPRIIEAKSKFPSRTIKIWSAGCSTGEEAYTLAITLLQEESGLLEDWTCIVLASDINQQAVEFARKGVYDTDTIRNLTPEIRQRYFVQKDGGFSICTQARDLVSFGQLNLLDAPHMSSMTNIDVIFCRNVLIYFDLAARAQVLEHFYNSLSPEESSFSILQNRCSTSPLIFPLSFCHRRPRTPEPRPSRRRTFCHD